MIPYQDLLLALTEWRARQGLPPLHGNDYLGALKQSRIDTSRAIAAVTGSLELLDIDTAGAEYDYDEPLAPPPVDQPITTSWSGYDDAAAVGDSDPYAADDQPGAAGYDEFDDEARPYGDEYAAQDQAGYGEYGEYGDQAATGYDGYGAADDAQPGYQDVDNQGGYDYGQAGYGAHSVGDSTAIYQDLVPRAPHEDVSAPASSPGLAPPPVFGFADDDEEESTMIGSMPAPTAPLPPIAPAAPPPSSEATAIFDTSLALNAAAQVQSEYGMPGGGVPSEPVYDSMAAAAEYQAERVAEREAAMSDLYHDDEHTYVPSSLHGLDPGYGASDADPPPLEPPPLAMGDDDFDIQFDDDENR